MRFMKMLADMSSFPLYDLGDLKNPIRVQFQKKCNLRAALGLAALTPAHPPHGQAAAG
jgi:hypothetical protein